MSETAKTHETLPNPGQVAPRYPEAEAEQTMKNLEAATQDAVNDSNLTVQHPSTTNFDLPEWAKVDKSVVDSRGIKAPGTYLPDQTGVKMIDRLTTDVGVETQGDFAKKASELLEKRKRALANQK